MSQNTAPDVAATESAPAPRPLGVVDAELVPPGTVLGGHYMVQRLLGQGAMAQVYEAQDRALNRSVAIKVSKRPHDGPISPLRREAQALAAVRAPSLVAVHHFGIHEGREFLVMELVRGTTLEATILDRVRTARPFTVAEVTAILRGIAEALRAVERAGGAHRDIKPANIMLAPPNRVVLMDFGVFQAEALQRPDYAAGTPLYMAPEAITNTVAPGLWHLVDLYALGVVGYELLTGSPPYSGRTNELLTRHLVDPVPDAGDKRRDIPSRLRHLVKRLMAKSPDDRPESAEAVLGELDAIRAASEATESRPISVLLVDDDPDALALFEQAIRTAAPGALIASARTAEEALARVRLRAPDVMVLDLRLPRMSGLELCLYLRGAGLAKETTIVTVSGASDRQDVAVLRRLGVQDCLAKDAGLVGELSSVMRRIARMR